MAIGVRRLGLVAAASILTIVAAATSIAASTPAVAVSPPAHVTTVVTDAISGHWDSPAHAPVGSLVSAGLTLSDIEPVHDVVVHIASMGPVTIKGSEHHARSFSFATLGRGKPLLPVPLTVKGTGGGSIDATISARNANGQHVGATESLSFSSDSSTVAFSPGGTMDAQRALLETHRGALGSVAYAEALNAIEGGGASVSIPPSPARATPALVPANLTPNISSTTTITGQIQYTAKDGSTHPARDTSVNIMDFNPALPNPNSFVMGVFADGAGRFSATVPTFRADGTTPRQLFIRALAENDVSSGTGPGDEEVAFDVHASGSTTAQFIDSSVPTTPGGTPVTVTAAGTPVVINMTANSTAVNDQAFGVADALETAARSSQQLDTCACLSATPLVNKDLSVVFPSPDDGDGATTFFQAGPPPQIFVGATDAFGWDAIIHEYGHYVASQLGIDDSPAGDHGFGSNNAASFAPPDKLKGTEVAWSEGFATFFEAMTEQAQNVPSLHIPDTPAGVYDDPINHIFVNLNIDNRNGAAGSIQQPAVGEDDELSVARILWHIYSDPDIAMPGAQILADLNQVHATTLSTAIAALVPDDNAAPFDDSVVSTPGAVKLSNTFGCVLSNSAVAPTIVTPSTGTQVQPGTPLTFQWKPGGAGILFPLNSFVVQFWSANWDKLVFSSPGQSGTSYTPSAADWKNNILGGKDASGGDVSSLNVTIKGTGAGSGFVTSGPYKSCAVTLKVNEPPADLTGPSGNAGGSLYGSSVGLSSDGLTSVVGAPGTCLGFIDTTSDCKAATVSFYTQDTNTNLWDTTATFTPTDLGLPGCSAGACPGAYVLGADVAMSADGKTAAASLAADPTATALNFDNEWELDVVTFALVNGKWQVTGIPTTGLDDTQEDNLGQEQAPYETVALDDVGDTMLVGDQYHENTNLEAGSDADNQKASDGIVYSFTSSGNGSAGGFTHTGTINDTNADPFGTANCGFAGCTLWEETFGSAIALSGDGKTATATEQGFFFSDTTTHVVTNETVDLYTATVNGSGTRTWGSTPSTLSGGDVAAGYDEQGSQITCSGKPCAPEDFGVALALSDNGKTVFVGDPSHNNGGGAIFVFTAPAAQSTYGQAAELNSSDANVSGLGAALATSHDGTQLVAGAPDSSLNGEPEAGVAELFSAGSGGWVDANQTADLTADDASNYDVFGTSVAITGDGSQTLIGSPGDLDFTAYQGGYDGAVYTLDGASDTVVTLTSPGLPSTLAGGVQGTTGGVAQLTATVSPVPSGGTVAFQDGSGPVAGCDLVPVDPTSGTAVCPVTLPGAPTVDPSTSVDSPLAYTATYSGAGTYGSSTSPSLDVSAVTPLAIATTSLPSIVAGTQIGVGGAVLGPLVAAGGSGTLSWTIIGDASDGLPDTMTLQSNGTFAGVIPTAGSYTFTVAVTDGSPIPQSVEQTLTWVVSAAPAVGPSVPTVVLLPLGALIYGTAASASVLVTSLGSNPPAGDIVVVTATQGTTVVGTCTATLPGGSSDAAHCLLPASLAAGTYALSATFEGAGSTVTGADATFASATSATRPLLVNPAPTITTITQPAPVAAGGAATIALTVTTTGLVAPPNGDVVHVTATPQGGSSQAATCVATLTNLSGVTGSCSLGALAVGTYTINASYGGDANYVTSFNTATLTIVNGTVTAVNAPTPGSTVKAGATVTYRATVTSPTSIGSPTGTLTFSVGTTALCSTNTLSAGVGSCTSSAAPVGTDTVTAAFSSDLGFSSTSGTSSFTVSIPPPAAPPGSTASASATSAIANGGASASVPGISATGTGTGSLTVATYSGVDPTGVSLTAGTGVYYDVAVGTGSTFSQLLITACNLGTGGDSLQWFNGSVWQPFSNQVVDTIGANAGCVTATVDTASSFTETSPTIQELIGTPIAAVNADVGDFTVNISPKSQNLGIDSSVGYTVTVGSTGGFAEPVALTVTGLPAGVTGAFNPPVVNPEGGTATAILTLTTGATLNNSGGAFSVNGTFGTGAGAVVHSANDGSVSLSFELQPTCFGSISGVVTDAQTQKPVDHAAVDVDSGFTKNETFTAADGSYTATNVPLGANNGTTTVSLTVSANGYYNDTQSGILVSCGPVGSFSPSLTEMETATLQGHVYVGVADPANPANGPVTPTSTPIGGAQLGLQEFNVNLDTNVLVSLNAAADGSYQFTNIPLNTGNTPLQDGLTIRGPTVNPPSAPLGYWAQSAHPQENAGTTTTADVALVPVCAGATITATVYSQDTGLPVANATVSDGLTTTTTDGNGVAQFSNLELNVNNSARQYALSASTASGATLTPVTVSLGACGDSTSASLYIHVPTNNFGSVTGTVVDSVTGNPLPSATIQTNFCTSNEGVESGPNALGQWSFTNELIGQDAQTSIECTFFATAPGYYTSPQVTVAVNADATSTVALALLPELSATITGTVTDATTGDPIAGVTVSGTTGTETDAAGQYTLTGNQFLGANNASRSDTFAFSIPSGGYLSTEASAEAVAGQTTVLNESLVRACGPATVTGAVYNASNQQPIVGALVQSGAGNVMTGANGLFQLQIPIPDNTPFGASLTASATGFNSKTEVVQVFCGAHVVLNFGQNNTETGTLTGTVTNATTNAPIAGAFVGTGFGATTTTNSSGLYTFSNVPLGNNNAAETWDVTVDPPSGSPLQPQIKSVSIPGNTTTTLNFVLNGTPPPPPIALNQSYVTGKNTTLTVGAPTGVLDGDSGTDITVSAAPSQTANFSQVAVNHDGSFTFVPENNFEGTDTFTYTISDEYGATATATVSVQVGPEAAAPTDVAYSESVASDTTLSVSAANGLASGATGTGLTFTLAHAPADGTAVVNADGSYTYTPAVHYFGSDSFTYLLTDAKGETVTKAVSVQVVPPAAPTAANMAVSTPFNHALSEPAPGIFAGATGVGLAYGGVSGPSHGTVAIQANGSYVYTPTTGYSGTDSFNYFIHDQYQRFANAVVTITVGAANAPAAVTDTGTTPFDAPLVVSAPGVLGNDLGTGISVTSHTAPANGTVTIAANGSYTYTPDPAFAGTDSFTYTITNGANLTSVGTVNLTVSPPAPPTAPNYTESTPFHTPLVVGGSGVLSGATGTGITAKLKTGATDGAALVQPDGSYRYTPYATYSGQDAFAYSVTDAFGQTATGTVTITVGNHANPAPPTAPDYTETTPFDTPLVVTTPNGLGSLATGTGLTFSIQAGASHGSAVVNADGSYTYTPGPSFGGSDSFTYVATDVANQTATGTVHITVGLPPAPTAPDYTESTPFDTPLVTTGTDGVLSMSTGTGLGATVGTSPSDGTVVLGANGAYTYTPKATFTGSDSFTYIVTDHFNRTATGTVHIAVGAPGAPNAPDYTESTPFEVPLVVDGAKGVLSGATGADLTLTMGTAPVHGTVSLNLTNGGYTYTPDALYAGPDSFTYTVTDVDQQVATGTVTISVLPLPVPTAADYAQTTAINTPLTVTGTGDLGSEDTGTGLSYALSSAAAHGTAVVNADGSYTYTPMTGFTGTDSFGYTVTDEDNQTATGLVTVTVTPPAPPVLTQVLPSVGPVAGGTAIQLVGTGFTGATEVEFGGTDYFLAGATPFATDSDHITSEPTFVLVSSTLITLVDPAGTGTIPVSVTTPVATSTVTSGDHFTYAAAAPVTTTTTTGTSTTTTTTVPVVPAAGVGPTPAPPTPASAPTSGLALTGIDLSLMLFGGAGLIGLGAFFVLSSRRVRRGQPGRHVRGG